MRAGLEEQAPRGGSDNVVFTGMVPRAELPAYLASSDACLVHFRKDELFGTILPSKLFEDAAMERPILLGFEGEAREMLEEADCGVAFEPSNDEELVAAAERLAAAPADERRRLGRPVGLRPRALRPSQARARLPRDPRARSAQHRRGRR